MSHHFDGAADANVVGSELIFQPGIDVSWFSVKMRRRAYPRREIPPCGRGFSRQRDLSIRLPWLDRFAKGPVFARNVVDFITILNVLFHRCHLSLIAQDALGLARVLRLIVEDPTAQEGAGGPGSGGRESRFRFRADFDGPRLYFGKGFATIAAL